MIIPEKIKIAGYEYKVERPERSFVNGINACDGLHQFNTQTIPRDLCGVRTLLKGYGYPPAARARDGGRVGEYRSWEVY